MEVVDRIATSMIPKRASPTYLKTHLGVNPGNNDNDIRPQRLYH